MEFAARLDVGHGGGVKERSNLFDLSSWNDGDTSC